MSKPCPCCEIDPIELGRRIKKAEEVIVELIGALSYAYEGSPEGRAYLDKMRAAIYKANGGRGEYDPANG